MIDDYRVTMLTTDRITAERPTPIGGKSEIHISDQNSRQGQTMNMVPNFELRRMDNRRSDSAPTLSGAGVAIRNAREIT
jgi:hypothetical protein